MKWVRSLHLYLGCVFAPLLILYAASGVWQVYRLNDAAKDGSYTPPVWLKTLSSVHLHQSLAKGTPATISKAIGAGLGLALAATAALGVVLAYKYQRRPGLVTLCLLAGVILPGLLLVLRL